jgi:hypothetical protein
MGKKILIIILLLVPTSSWAANNLEKAKKLTAQMKYMQALWDINQVLKSSKSGPEDLVAAYELKGMCMAALGKEKESIISYRYLLAINPDHKLSPKVSPKFKQPFERALELSHGKKSIELVHEVPEPAEKLSGMKIKVSVDANPYKMVKRVRLRYKAGKAKEKQLVIKVKRTGEKVFKLPVKTKAGSLSYYFEALNWRGGVVQRLGSRNAPYSFVVGPKAIEKSVPKPVVADAVPDEKESKPDTPVDSPVRKQKSIDEMTSEAAKPGAGEKAAVIADSDTEKSDDEDGGGAGPAWYKTWWFWTGVGVVLAGTATGIAVGVTSGGSSGDMRYDVFIR